MSNESLRYWAIYQVTNDGTKEWLWKDVTERQYETRYDKVWHNRVRFPTKAKACERRWALEGYHNRPHRVVRITVRRKP